MNREEKLRVRVRDLIVEIMDLKAQAKTLAIARNGFADRVRELEAELERSRKAGNEGGRWLSRAEKAEARVAKLADVLDWHHRWYDDKDECKVAKSLRLREREE